MATIKELWEMRKQFGGVARRDVRIAWFTYMKIIYMKDICPLSPEMIGSWIVEMDSKSLREIEKILDTEFSVHD